MNLLESIIFAPGVKCLLSYQGTGASSFAINVASMYPEEVEYIEAIKNSDPNIYRAINMISKKVIFIDEAFSLSDSQLNQIIETKKSVWLLGRVTRGFKEDQGEFRSYKEIPPCFAKNINDRFHIFRSEEDGTKKINFARFESNDALFTMVIEGYVTKSYMELNFCPDKQKVSK